MRSGPTSSHRWAAGWLFSTTHRPQAPTIRQVNLLQAAARCHAEAPGYRANPQVLALLEDTI